MLLLIVVVLVLLTPVLFIAVILSAPIIVPLIMLWCVWLASKKLSAWGNQTASYDKMVIEARQTLLSSEIVQVVAPRPHGKTPEKVLFRGGYTIEMFLSVKPPVYRVLNPDMEDFGVNYDSLAEAKLEADSYSGFTEEDNA